MLSASLPDVPNCPIEGRIRIMRDRESGMAAREWQYSMCCDSLIAGLPPARSPLFDGVNGTLFEGESG